MQCHLESRQSAPVRHRVNMAEHKHLGSVAKSVENFTVDFHKSIAGKTDGNFVSSALSAHTVLAMTAYGAEGSTKDQMRQSLHLPENDQLAHQGFQALIDVFNTVQGIALKVANKIYASKCIEIKEKFKEITSTYFRSESDTLDFSKNVEAANEINKWCVDQTNGKIKDIVSSDCLNGGITMILLNAVYFKGNWKHKFSESATADKPFHINKTTTIQVPTMCIKKNFFHKDLNELNAEVVGLPYQNEDFYMLIIFPKEIDGLKNLEQNLEKINLDFELVSRKRTEICLSLPKFKIETTIDLNSHLTELGMSEMFSSEANFNGISNTNMKVDKVIQKAFIEVNEEGTEAAAVTGMRLMKRSLPMHLEIQVDKPFLYRIIHIKSETTLFSGCIVNPIAA